MMIDWFIGTATVLIQLLRHGARERRERER
jgi:hypothetical protein